MTHFDERDPAIAFEEFVKGKLKELEERIKSLECPPHYTIRAQNITPEMRKELEAVKREEARLMAEGKIKLYPGDGT